MKTPGGEPGEAAGAEPGRRDGKHTGPEVISEGTIEANLRSERARLAFLRAGKSWPGHMFSAVDLQNGTNHENRSELEFSDTHI